MVTEQHQNWELELRPQLASVGVRLLNYSDLKGEEQLYLQDYFDQRVFPILTPLAVDSAHPFPLMANFSLNLAVVVKNPKTGSNKIRQNRTTVY